MSQEGNSMEGLPLWKQDALRDIGVLEKKYEALIEGVGILEKRNVVNSLEKRLNMGLEKIKDRMEVDLIGMNYLKIGGDLLKEEYYGGALFYADVARFYFNKINDNVGVEDCCSIKELSFMGFYLDAKDKLKDSGIDITVENAYPIIQEHSTQFAMYQEMISCLKDVVGIVVGGAHDAGLKLRVYMDNAKAEMRNKKDGEYILMHVGDILDWESWKGDNGIDLGRAKRGLGYLMENDIIGEFDEQFNVIREKIGDMEMGE